MEPNQNLATPDQPNDVQPDNLQPTQEQPTAETAPQASVPVANQPQSTETVYATLPEAPSAPQPLSNANVQPVQEGPILQAAPTGFDARKHWKLGTVATLGIGMAGLTLLALSSKDEGFVSMIAGLIQLGGLIFSLAAGMAAARAAQKRIELRNSGKPYAGSNPFTGAGIALCILGVFTGGILLLPGIVLLIMGGNKPSPMIQPKTPIKGFAKFMLVALSFAAGAIPAAIFSFVMLIIVSVHYCNISSSKCM